MKAPCSKLYLTQAIKIQNRTQQNDASVTVIGITLTDSGDHRMNDLQFAGDLTVSANKKFSEAPAHLISLCSEHYVLLNMD
jgi:hypothetical protein